MTTKCLSIRDEAFKRLKSFKSVDESFSDVIMRITDGEPDFREGFGMWKDREGIDKVIEEGRERLDRDLRGSE
ncbi:MAG: antitoxin VapB family protein [Candidatus Nanohaloarchaea archaeon]